MERRIYGLENEYGVTCTLRGQRRLSPDEVARYLFRRVGQLGPQLQRVPAERRPPVPRRRLAPRVRHARVRLAVRPRRPRQGGRADPREPASSRPSSASPRRRSAARSTCSRTTPTRPATATAATRTTCTSRADDLGHYAEVLIPFFVSRQIYTGAGKVLQTARGAIVLDRPARRAHLGGRVSSATTRSRPIINTRDEPHADAERYRRLHVIVGDSNMSEYTTFVKVGAAACMLRMLEDPTRRAARHDAGEPDPGDPRDQPRHDLPAHGPPGQRPRGQRPRHPARVPRPGAALRRHQGLPAARAEGAGDVGALHHRRSRTTR